MPPVLLMLWVCSPDRDNYQPIYPRVFDLPTATTALGITPQMVPFGTASFPYVNTGAAADATVGEGLRSVAQEIKLTTREMVPDEVSSAVDITALAIHRMGPQLEAVTLADMMADLADKFESLVVSEFDTDIADPNDPSAVTTWADAVGLPSLYVDGKYAGGMADLGIVWNPDVMRYLDALFQTNSETSAWEKIGARVGRNAVSAKVPVIASDVGYGFLRRGMAAGSFRWPVWDAAELVVDRTSTGGRKVLITLTATFAMGIENGRRDSFEKVAVKTA